MVKKIQGHIREKVCTFKVTSKGKKDARSRQGWMFKLTSVGEEDARKEMRLNELGQQK